MTTTRANRAFAALGSLIAVAFASLMISAKAEAAYTAAIGAGTVTLSGDAEADRLTISAQSGNLAHNLPGFESAIDWDLAPGIQTLPADGSITIVVNAAAGDDSVTGPSGPSDIEKLVVDGGAGDDAIIGSARPDELSGADGDDLLIPARGSDLQVSGGAGDDVIVWVNGDGTDTLDGAEGFDTVEVDGDPTRGDEFSAQPFGSGLQVARTNLAPFSLDASAVEQISLNTLGGADTATPAAGLGTVAFTIDGGAGPDLLQGAEAADTLQGGAGADQLDPGLGADVVEGGSGDDQLALRDGAADLARCGQGTDVAVADAVGTDLLIDCEAIDQPDVKAPVLAVQAAKKQKLGKTVQVGVRADEAATARVAGTLTVQTVTRKKRFKLKPATGELDAALRKVLKPALSKKARKAAAAALDAGRKVSAKLKITATDAAGNAARVSRTVTLR